MDYYPKYKKYKMKYLELKNKYEMNGGGEDKKELVLFRAEWCPHCRNFVSDWNDLEKSNTDFKFVLVDESDIDLVRIYEEKDIKASAYPTLFLGKNDEYMEYIGPMKKDSIQNFLKKF